MVYVEHDRLQDLVRSDRKLLCGDAFEYRLIVSAVARTGGVEPASTADAIVLRRTPAVMVTMPR